MSREIVYVVYELVGSYDTDILGVFSDRDASEKCRYAQTFPGNCGIESIALDRSLGGESE